MGDRETWQVTCDTWHVTPDKWHVTWRILCENCRSLSLTVWERLKSDMWHVKHDTWKVISKSMIYPPGKYKPILIVSKFSIISKITSFLLKLDLHWNLPKFQKCLKHQWPIFNSLSETESEQLLLLKSYSLKTKSNGARACSFCYDSVS